MNALALLFLLSPLLAAGQPTPSPEICAKVREARVRQERYEELYVSHTKLEVLAAKESLLYTQMGYSPRQKEDRMADTYRGLEESRRRVQDAKAAYDRLADDLIGKVEKPWPACEQ
jgi:hypothetical protein